MGTLDYKIQILHLKTSYLKYFSVIFGCCNLELSSVFLESTDIIEHCYVFGFLGTCHVLT